MGASPVKKLLFAAFLSAVFFMAPAMLPLLGMCLGYLCPLPLIWAYLCYGRDSGRKTMLIAFIMVLALTTLFSGVFMGISYIYHLGLAGGMGEAISRHKSRITMIAWGIVAASLGNLALMLFTAWYNGQAPLAFWATYWQHMVFLVAQQIQANGADPAQVETVSRFMHGLIALAPCVLIIIACMVCWLNLWALNRLGNKYLPGVDWGYGNLTNWRTPEKLVWLFILSAALFWLSEGTISWLALNVLILSCLAYWFHGMAVANWWADKRNLPTWGRVIFLIVCFLLPFLLFGVALVGLFDTWFNWRRLGRLDEQSGGLR